MGKFGRKLKREGGHLSGKTDAAKDRQHLFEYNRGNIGGALQLWLAEGRDVRDAVVMVVDTRDPIGRSFIEAVAPEELPKATAVERNAQIPTFTASISREEAVQGLLKSQPNIADKLRERPPDGNFWCVVIASGGALLAVPPILESKGSVGDAN